MTHGNPMSTRTRKAQKTYNQYLKTTPKTDHCEFCNILEHRENLLHETKSFMIIKNKFPYSQWDDQGVSEHLMIVPKKHTDTISSFTKSESVEFIDLLGSYEARDYDIAARAPKSNRKSIRHQHTHLIKLDRKTKNFMVFVKKPYLRIQK